MDDEDDVYQSKEEAIAAVLRETDIGEYIWVCRGNWEFCASGATCTCCANIKVTRGMTVKDVMQMIKPN